MERLTMTSDKGGVAFTFDLDITCKPSEAQKILKLAERLKEYEDLEEQGLLVKLPCKACDVLYSFVNGKTIELEVLSIKYQIEAENHGIFIRERIIIDADGIETEINFSDIGKIVFLTQEEAEQALKRLESEQE